MYSEEEKDVIEAEEVKETETKTEDKKDESNNGKKEYHIIKENFNKALIWAIIGLAIQTVIVIFLTIINHTIDNEGVRLLINCIGDAIQCAGLVIVGIVELRLFLNETNPKRDKDIASFIISLVAFILAFLTALYAGIESIRELVGAIHEFLN
ncbi:MAG: hypothetical protein K6E87_04965 [bacterium]|nr:hypothetical protein [bacterium]